MTGNHRYSGSYRGVLFGAILALISEFSRVVEKPEKSLPDRPGPPPARPGNFARARENPGGPPGASGDPPGIPQVIGYSDIAVYRGR